MSKATRKYRRFSLARRVEHLVMLLAFSALAATGLPQKFPESGVAVFLVRLLGGIESIRTIHHTAAAVMMLGTAWHILVAGYHFFVLRTQMTMLPTLKDAKDAWEALRHNIGLRPTYPQMGRYTFDEKLEYWAFVWGALIMGFTGFLMWNPITVTRFLPGESIPAAKAAHGGEALLAVLAIVIWHMYGVHIKRFNKSMWTGTQSEAEMLHEHPLELADLKAGIAGRRPDTGTLRRREMIYFPVAAVLGIIMLGGIFGFINAEQTALTTIPPRTTGAIFLMQTPTTSPTSFPATPAPSQASSTEIASAPTWQDQVAVILQAKCVPCHGPAGMGGLDLSTYAAAAAGGGSGPAFVAGNAAGSLLVSKQQAGGHPGQLSPQEIDVMVAWINGGAPER